MCTSLCSEREVRLIVRTAATRDYTPAQIKVMLKCRCSARTIRHISDDIDWLLYTKIQATLPLTSSHVQARREWAKVMVRRSDIWPPLIFSDEKKFNLDDPDGFRHSWWDVRQPLRLSARRQSGGVGDGKQNWDDCVYTMSEYLPPLAHHHYDTEFVAVGTGSWLHAPMQLWTKASSIGNYAVMIAWTHLDAA
ncbi:hypothetical protein FI667_g2938, partial [Globisporangium splendens]